MSWVVHWPKKKKWWLNLKSLVKFNETIAPRFQMQVHKKKKSKLKTNAEETEEASPPKRRSVCTRGPYVSY